MSRFCPSVLLVCLASAACPAQEADPAHPPMVADGGGLILIAPSRSGRTLYGYSMQTGAWEGIAVIKPDGAPLVPIVSSGLGYVVAGKRIYALSGGTGKWAVVELAKEATPKLAVGSRLRVDDGSTIHMYSAVVGRWSSVNLAGDEK